MIGSLAAIQRLQWFMRLFLLWPWFPLLGHDEAFVRSETNNDVATVASVLWSWLQGSLPKQTSLCCGLHVACRKHARGTRPGSIQPSLPSIKRQHGHVRTQRRLGEHVLHSHTCVRAPAHLATTARQSGGSDRAEGRRPPRSPRCAVAATARITGLWVISDLRGSKSRWHHAGAVPPPSFSFVQGVRGGRPWI
jgi:hypothetical protein